MPIIILLYKFHRYNLTKKEDFLLGIIMQRNKQCQVHICWLFSLYLLYFFCAY